MAKSESNRVVIAALLGNVVGTYGDGVSGTPSLAYTGNRELSTAGTASLDLRPATAATDPDLSFAVAYR